jgi:uncharacterized protein (DUF1499 family)
MDNAQFSPMILCAAAAGLIIASCSGTRPGNLGITNGMLAPCPSTPNCVSSQSRDPEHVVAALAYTSSPAEAMAKLKRIVQAMPRTLIVTETPAYLHAEFTSAIMRFVDDVEFSLDESTRSINMRSASRVGKSDLGVNRKRVEEIRSKWMTGGQ